MVKEKITKEFTFSSADLIVFAWEKRVPLAIITIAAAIASVIISLSITNLYKSQVVLFPAPNTSVSKYLLSDQYAGRTGLLAFGEEEQTEQMLQILQSDQIKNWIIQKYDLMNHYDIDSSFKYKYTVLDKKYKKYVKYRRTKYMSIVIEVLDKDPYMAANIANDISNLIDSTMRRIQRDRAYLAYKLVEQEYVDIQNHIQKMEDSLNVLRTLGIYDYEAQSAALAKAYNDAVSRNNQYAIKIVSDQIDNIVKYGGAYLSLIEYIKEEKTIFTTLKQKYAEAKVEFEQTLPYKYIVDAAVPAERKYYPKRSLIVIQSTFFAFVLGYVLLLIYNIIREHQKAKN